jgi:N utilization substance protein B
MSRGEKRSAARLAAVQALYQMDLSAKGVSDVMAEFEAHWMGREIEDGLEMRDAESAFFRDIVQGVVDEQRVLDREVDSALAKGWPLARIETVLRAVLRCGAYELFRRKDIPAKVVITEYGDVARAFYEGEEVGMVNAVLDSVARAFRPDELDPRRR